MSAHNYQKRLADGYATSNPPAKDPIPFTPRTDMERLRILRQTDPKAFDRFGPERRIALGHYEEARKAAGYEQEDDHGDNNEAA